MTASVKKIIRMPFGKRMDLFNRITSHLDDPDYQQFENYEEAAVHFAPIIDWPPLNKNHFKSLDDLPVHMLLDPTKAQRGGLVHIWAAIREIQYRLGELEDIITKTS